MRSRTRSRSSSWSTARRKVQRLWVTVGSTPGSANGAGTPRLRPCQHRQARPQGTFPHPGGRVLQRREHPRLPCGGHLQREPHPRHRRCAACACGISAGRRRMTGARRAPSWLSGWRCMRPTPVCPGTPAGAVGLRGLHPYPHPLQQLPRPVRPDRRQGTGGGAGRPPLRRAAAETRRAEPACRDRRWWWSTRPSRVRRRPTRSKANLIAHPSTRAARSTTTRAEMVAGPGQRAAA